MKLQTLLLASALLLVSQVYAQSPEGFNYQAVVRNTTGEILVNQPVGIQMSLIQGTANGSVVYRETFNKTTNAFGLINLVIGTGNVTTGSFASIDWGKGPYFLETAIDENGATNYAVLGTSQLMSVPFALYAKTAANGGVNGQDGASAYQIWLNAGNTGSEADFLASLKGSNAATQDISLSGTQLSISEGSTIDLSVINTDTNTQLTEAEVVDFVANNGFIKAEVDGDVTNEIQDLALSGSTLTITNNSKATGIDLAQFVGVNTDSQDLQLNGSSLSLTGDPDNTTVDLAAFDTDTQLSEAEVVDFVTTNGFLTAEVDGDITNEIQDLALSGSTLTITNNSTATAIDLAQFVGVNTDSQDLQLNGTSLSLTGDPDNTTVNLAAFDTNTQLTEAEVVDFVTTNGFLTAEVDGDVTNELQTISRIDDNITLSNGGGTVSVLDADANPTNEIQTLALIEGGEVLQISDGNYVTLTDYSPTNELTTSVMLNGTMLETTDAGGTITTDLSSLADDADADPANELNTTIVLNGTTLETTDAGGTITTDLSTLVDDADADPENEIQDLKVLGDTLFLTGKSTPTKVLLGGRNSYGDIKHSFQLEDHDGWYKLDGRFLSELVPETAAKVAAIFFENRLPDATDRFLKGNNGSETNGDVGGSTSIAQGNLPAYNLSGGSTSADGSHDHGGNTNLAGFFSDGRTIVTKNTNSNFSQLGTASAISSITVNTYNIPSHDHSIPTEPAHSHSIASLPSGGNGVPYYQPYLTTNIFVYLGSATLGDLQNLGLSNQEILTSGVSPKTLWNDNNAILDELIGLEYNGNPINLQTFVDQGIDLPFLYTKYGQSLLDDTSVTTLDLFNAGVTIATLNGNSISVSTMRTDGIEITAIHGSGLFSFQNLRDGGFAIEDIVTLTDYQTMVDQGVATYQEFLDVPTTPLMLWEANDAVLDDLLGLTYSSNPITLQTFVDQGISLSFLYGQYVNDVLSLTTTTTLDLFNDGVSIASMNTNGVSLAVMATDGIEIGSLNDAGIYSLQQLKNNFDAATMLSIFSVSQLLDENGNGTDITVFELRAGGATAAEFHGVPYQGGLIFYTQADGTTYVAQATDQSTGIGWAAPGTGVSTNSNIGNGSTNTDNILTYDAGPNAASVCRDLGADWYLPNRSEIREMYDNLHIKGFGDFTTSAEYWMSDDDGNNTRAGSFSFSDRSNNQVDRGTLLYVRAIKSFVSAP